MSDDLAEKTEQPTARKQEQAREKGNVPKSQELTASVMLLGGIILLYVLSTYIYDLLHKGMTGILSHLYAPIETIDMVTYWVRHGLFYLLSLLLPFLMGLIFVAVLVNIYQVGWVISPDSLGFKWEKLNIFDPKNFGRFFNLRAGMRLVQGILKIMAIGLICYFEIKKILTHLVNLIDVPVAKALYFIASESLMLAFKLAAMLFLLGFADWIFQKWKRMQDLKMSRQEVKEEHKQMEGDPKVKSRIRSVMHAMTQRRMKNTIPKANVVVTNPTHYAVALYYDDKTMQAPMCVGKGARKIAQKIKDIAREHQIPILENPPLARALYRMVEAGQSIPSQFYHPVAEVLAYVYRLNESLRRNQGVAVYKPTPVIEEELVSKKAAKLLDS